MDNFGKMYAVKVRIHNALYETILPSPMVDDVSLRGIWSSVVEHLQLTHPASYLIGKYSTEVELLSTEEYSIQTAATASQPSQALEVEVSNVSMFLIILC